MLNPAQLKKRRRRARGLLQVGSWLDVYLSSSEEEEEKENTWLDPTYHFLQNFSQSVNIIGLLCLAT